MNFYFVTYIWYFYYLENVLKVKLSMCECDAYISQSMAKIVFRAKIYQSSM